MLTKTTLFVKLTLHGLNTDDFSSEVLKWLYPEAKRQRQEPAGGRQST
jgi:hypothetical protein